MLLPLRLSSPDILKSAPSLVSSPHIHSLLAAEIFLLKTFETLYRYSSYSPYTLSDIWLFIANTSYQQWMYTVSTRIHIISKGYTVSVLYLTLFD